MMVLLRLNSAAFILLVVGILLQKAVNVSAFSSGAAGLLLGPYDRVPKVSCGVLAASKQDYNGPANGLITLTDTNNNGLDRRSWLADAAKILGGFVAGGTATLSTPREVSASTAVADADVKTAPSLPPSLCDPSVSTWRNPANNRIVHILGTAHISESSAQLAGTIVKEVKPNAVFVELDRKRISRALPGGGDGGTQSSSKSSADGDETGVASQGNQAAMANIDANNASDQPQQQQRRQNPFAVKDRMLQAGAKLVGESIKTMYSKLDSEGFKAGEEFVLAIREGLAINAAIVLGDRDVEVTLRRLTEALSKTDLKKLFASDSDLEQSLNSLMPGGGKGSYALSDSRSGDGSKEAVSKEQFKEFVETVKARENVRLVMSQLKATAPELYDAMVGERDAYMARGLATLDQFSTMVAVMGIAHVDGVESNLKERGWVPVSVPCQLK